jgi:hypothetical protein
VTLVEVVAARLREAFPARVTFEWAVPNKMPDGSATPPRCYIVSANVGDEESATVADERGVRSPVLWVRCVSQRESPDMAAREVARWAADARDALRGFVPMVGRMAWALDHLVSSQPFSESGLPGSSWSATEQWLAQYQA